MVVGYANPRADRQPLGGAPLSSLDPVDHLDPLDSLDPLDPEHLLWVVGTHPYIYPGPPDPID